MIKINLLNSKKKSKIKVNQSSKTIEEPTNLSVEEVKKESMRRILLIFILPLCLIIYEALSIPDLQAEMLSEEKKYKELTEFNNKNSQIAESIKRMQNRENLITLKIAEVQKKISEKNIRVEMLDVLQQLIPDRIWLTKLTESKSNVTLSGMAVSESELNGFLEAMSKSIIFKEVNILNSNQITYEGNSLKKFELSFKLGGKNE